MTRNRKNYNWNRYWCPRGSTISLGDEGYLLDPDSEFGRFFNEDLVTLEYLADVPCVVLLGEPGIGKTTALDENYALCKARLKSQPVESFKLDLRSFGDENRLVRRLFENEVFSKWISGKHKLSLFLDSFDECALRLDSLAVLLIDEFKNRTLQFQRLCLRIACRTAVWPTLLEEEFRHFWGDDAVQVYEMAPLMRSDVSEAAEANGLEAATFLSGVQNREAVPFAIKPITLDLLIRLFKGPEKLPTTRLELYERGVRKLCEETSESRRNTGHIGALDVDQRVAIAGRIAATTLLCARNAIWTGGDDGALTETDIPLWDLKGGSERGKCGSFEGIEVALRETLDTGLFTERGPKRMGWAHQTYAEFLAARYLKEHEFTVAQIRGALFQRSGAELKAVPQHYGPAAWLACQRLDIFQELLQNDPAAILSGDLATTNDNDREALVGAILDAIGRDDFTELNQQHRVGFGKLNHPRLSEQLLSYITDRSQGYPVRREAITIATRCEARDVAGNLLNIALDSSEDIGVREFAAGALVQIGEEPQKAALTDLASFSVPEDTLDTLKGYALQACWPSHMSVTEVLGALSKPKKENLVGSYSDFIFHYFPKGLTPEDVVTALKWVGDQPSREHIPSEFQSLMMSILEKAWEHFDYPGVLESFSSAVLKRLRLDRHMLHYTSDTKAWNRIISEDHKRRRVIETILPTLSPVGDDAIKVTDPETPLILDQDFSWLLDKLKATTSETTELMLVSLTKHTFHRGDPNLVEAVLEAVHANEKLAEEFAWLWKPIGLHTADAESLRQDHSRRIERQQARKKYERASDAQWTKMMSFLEQSEAGNHEAFLPLIVSMTLRSPSPNVAASLEPDLTELPGWKKADGPTRRRITGAAISYLLNHDPTPLECGAKKGLNLGEFAGYLALRLLRSQAPNFLRTMPANRWKKWAPIVIAVPGPLGDGRDAPDVALASLAYKSAPEELIAALMDVIDKENREVGAISSLWKIRFQWDEALSRAMIAKLKDDTLTVDSLANLLAELLDRDLPEAIPFAASLVREPAGPPEDCELQRIMGAFLLLTHTREAGWPVVWPAIESNVDFGRKLMLRVAREDLFSHRSAMRSLTAEQLARLYMWLVVQFPFDEDPKEEGGRRDLAHWRDSIPPDLRDRGTHEAIEALELMKAKFPLLDWIKSYIASAKEQLRRRTWVPLQPHEILAMAAENDRRYEGQKMGRMIPVHEIDQFAKAITIPDDTINDAILSGLRDLDEKTELEPFIRQIIHDPNETPHGPTELADILTTHVIVGGQAKLAGFILKGRSFKQVRNQDVSHQVDKLTTIGGIGVAVFVAVGNIQDEAARNFTNRAQEKGWDWLVLGAHDLARLLIAYAKICPQDGTPFDQTGGCKHGHAGPETTKLTLPVGEPPKGTILSLEDLSNLQAKRYSAVVLVDPHYDREVIRLIIRETIEKVRGENYYRSTKLEQVYGNNPAHVVWLYLGLDNDDVRAKNWFCRAQWIDPSLPAESRPKELDGHERDGALIIYWNDGYRAVKDFGARLTGTKRGVLDAIASLGQEMLSISDEGISLYRQYSTGEIPEQVFVSFMKEKRARVQELYRESGDIPHGALDCQDYENAFQCLVASIDTMFLDFEDDTLQQLTPKDRDARMERNVGATEENLKDFEFEKKKLR